MRRTPILALIAVLAAHAGPARKDVGYRGIWYYNQATTDEDYLYKYAGGLGTFPQTHMPMAVYSKEANKTFFCYGGTPLGRNTLVIEVSYYDHATKMVPRPTILLNKKTDDAHDTPTIALDGEGYLWVFSNAHGTWRPAFVHKSKKPYSIDEFELIKEVNFSYLQPWYFAGKGFLLLHTIYSPGRNLFWMHSPDGVTWTERQPLARFGEGHYSTSWRHGDRIGMAINYHPHGTGLNFRTNLYYLETADFAKTWRTADGKTLQTPLTDRENPALVQEYESKGLLVYLKDLEFDEAGRPVILYITSRGWKPIAESDPRTWNTAQWNGKTWDIRPVTVSDDNYDFGPLYIERDGTWRIIAPTDPGATPHTTGGDVVMWTSRDRGKNWTRVKQLTRGGRTQHSYVRKPLNAHPDFYAFWADGEGRRLSESHLYFTDREGSHVWRLPPVMKGEFAKPEIVY